MRTFLFVFLFLFGAGCFAQEERKDYSFFKDGHVILGSEYGLNPTLLTQDQPSLNVFLRGATGVTLKKLPFNVEWGLNSNPSALGLNNYFRISFDADQHRRNLSKKRSDLESILENKIDSLQKTRQLLLKQHQYMISRPVEGMFSDLNTKNIQKLLPDSLLNVPSNQTIDTSFSIAPDEVTHMLSGSAKLPVPIDSLDPTNPSAEWMGWMSEYKELMVEEVKQKAMKCEESLNSSQGTLDSLKSLGNTSIIPSRIKPSFKLRSLELGLQFPTQSEFLIRGIALRGASVEIESKRYYLWLCGGQSINQLFRSNDLISNKTQLEQTLYNYFDFSGNAGGRNLIALKGGLGTVEGNHIYVGASFASGLPVSALLDSSETLPSIPQRNVAVELDAQWKLLKNHRVRLFYGRTVLWSKGESSIVAVKGLFRTDAYTNGAILIYKGQFPKIRGDVEARVRFIDPEFKSLGVFGLRSDNLRFQISASTAITKKWKIRIRARRDSDDVRNQTDVSNELITAGVQIAGRIGKRVQVSAGYDPLVQRITVGASDAPIRNKNLMANTMVSWLPSGKKGSLQYILTANYIHLVSTAGISRFGVGATELSYSVDRFQQALGGTVFLTDTAANRDDFMTLLYYRSGWQSKSGIKLLANFKLMLSEESGIGGGIAVEIPLRNWLRVELRGDRLVYGDYFNVFNFEEWRKFPYLLTANVRVNW